MDTMKTLAWVAWIGVGGMWLGELLLDNRPMVFAGAAVLGLSVVAQVAIVAHRAKRGAR